ncbi:hypothetical protein Pint_14284 [Pistacia integerrima]|uniref:Uncharacterized protein n=1 Tax=Pistacia integerrima TaxID=434235 RepID=A0ACC0YAT6_9ROSI|nr:hypothetical protein Pint_14284 [Pistacia integerrima]
MTNQVLHCEVRRMSDGEEFHCSIIYAVNDYMGRRILWSDLC